MEFIFGYLPAEDWNSHFSRFPPSVEGARENLTISWHAADLVVLSGNAWKVASLILLFVREGFQAELMDLRSQRTKQCPLH